MTREEALGIAARIYTQPKHAHKVLDPDLCESIADELIRAGNWVESARQFARNADYYRSLVVQIGELFGEEAKTSDDGSVQHDVLCAKVPELVRTLKKQFEFQEDNAWSKDR